MSPRAQARAPTPPPRCFSCNYSLASLPDSASCPECGAPARNSLHGTLLHRADQRHLRALRRGAILLFLSLCAALAAPLSARASRAITDAIRIGTGATTSLWPTTQPVAELRRADRHLLRLDIECDGAIRVIHRLPDDTSISTRIPAHGEWTFESSPYDPQALGWNLSPAPRPAPALPPSIQQRARAALERLLGLAANLPERAALVEDGSIVGLLPCDEHEIRVRALLPGGAPRIIAVGEHGQADIRPITRPTLARDWYSNAVYNARPYQILRFLNLITRQAPLAALTFLAAAAWLLTRRDRGRATPTAPHFRLIVRAAALLAFLPAALVEASMQAFMANPGRFATFAPFAIPYGGWWLPLIACATLAPAVALVGAHTAALFNRLQDRPGAIATIAILTLALTALLALNIWPTLIWILGSRTNIRAYWQPPRTLTTWAPYPILALALLLTLRLRRQLNRHARKESPA